MERLRFYDFMRAGHVKRWHIVHTIRDQSIAEHQYLVTVVAMELFSRMAGKLGLDESAWLPLIVGAMFHDAPEVRYGDFPSPAKAHIREMGAPDVFEKLDKALMPKLPYVGGDMGQVVHDIISMADAIEAAHWISENKAGVHAAHVAKGNARRMAEMVIGLTERTGVDWFDAVNAVLIELGMPYLSKSMLVTPP